MFHMTVFVGAFTKFKFNCVMNSAVARVVQKMLWLRQQCLIQVRGLCDVLAQVKRWLLNSLNWRLFWIVQNLVKVARTSRVQIKICDVLRCYEVHPLYYSSLGTYPWYWGPCTCGQKSRSRSFCQVSGRHCIPATCHGRNKGRTRTKLTQSQRDCQDTKTQWIW
jgi:hypothetical protein